MKAVRTLTPCRKISDIYENSDSLRLNFLI